MGTETDTSTAKGRSSGKGESRRNELLEIATRVFAEKGIASATVRDIAQEAGILSGSLYHHFASKEEMVKEIVGDGPGRRSQPVRGDRRQRLGTDRGDPRLHPQRRALGGAQPAQGADLPQ